MKRRIVLPDVEEVKLPVLFNLRPGVYLLILYTLIFLILLFCVAYLPGILKGGRYVMFPSLLKESGVVVDGTYLGSADNQYFIASGEHEVSYVKAGIVYASYTMRIDHPVFLTWLIHRTQTAPAPTLDATAEQKKAIIRYDLDQIAKTSAILSYDSVTRYEPVYSNLLADLQALNSDKATTEQAIELALLYITNQTMLSDAQQALKQQQNVQTPFMQDTLRKAELLVSQNATAVVGMASQSVPLQKSEVYLGAGELRMQGYLYGEATFVMGTEKNLNYPAINEAGVEVSTPAFALAAYEVSQYQWALFLQENPMWEKVNLSSLMQQGLVDASYLSGLALSTIFVTNKPIYNISYYAAQAFCAWLSEKTGKRVFLPTESMWTIAALSHENLKFDASLSPIPSQIKEPVSLLGGVWEMTQTTYIPLSRITDYAKAYSLHEGFGLAPQPIVKGGSYLNDAKSISLNTVGVVDPDACGDFIGFRVAWYE